MVRWVATSSFAGCVSRGRGRQASSSSEVKVDTEATATAFVCRRLQEVEGEQFGLSHSKAAPSERPSSSEPRTLAVGPILPVGSDPRPSHWRTRFLVNVRPVRRGHLGLTRLEAGGKRAHRARTVRRHHLRGLRAGPVVWEAAQRQAPSPAGQETQEPMRRTAAYPLQRVARMAGPAARVAAVRAEKEERADKEGMATSTPARACTRGRPEMVGLVGLAGPVAEARAVTEVTEETEARQDPVALPELPARACQVTVETAATRESTGGTPPARVRAPRDLVAGRRALSGVNRMATMVRSVPSDT